VTISGGVGVHHYTSLGSYSFVGGLSRVLHDVPPYMLVEGSPTRPRCVNVVALKRNKFPAEAIRALSEAHRLLYRSRVGVENAMEIMKSNGKLLPEVQHLMTFISNQTEGRHGRGRDRRKAA
jgi:UDP-N-acetylglucosamine acyltransferase